MVPVLAIGRRMLDDRSARRHGGSGDDAIFRPDLVAPTSASIVIYTANHAGQWTLRTGSDALVSVHEGFEALQTASEVEDNGTIVHRVGMRSVIGNPDIVAKGKMITLSIDSRSSSEDR